MQEVLFDLQLSAEKSQFLLILYFGAPGTADLSSNPLKSTIVEKSEAKQEAWVGPFKKPL